MTNNDNIFTRTSAKELGNEAKSDIDVNSLFSYGGKRLPVYFLSHGGPNFLYPSNSPDADIGAWKTTAELGKYIKETIKPNFIIVVSAHWQSMGSKVIHIGIPESVSGAGVDVANDFFQPHHYTDNQGGHINPLENKLIYDFTGFPKKLYREKFRSKSSISLAAHIAEELNKSDAGFSASLVKRGIDHGVWVPFKIVFGELNSDPEWHLDIPLVQVSLAGTNDFDTHYKLGQVLAKYRDLGGLTVASGMSVHNLKDLYTSAMAGKSMPYVRPFTELLNSILVSEENAGKKLELLKLLKSDPHSKRLFSLAHPTLDHFLPIVVGLGAGEGLPGKDQYTVKELYNNCSLSLGWGIYQYGDY